MTKGVQEMVLSFQSRRWCAGKVMEGSCSALYFQRLKTEARDLKGG